MTDDAPAQLNQETCSVLRLRGTGLFFNVHADVLLPFQEPSSLLKADGETLIFNP